jgi:general secretion pathway protein E
MSQPSEKKKKLGEILLTHTSLDEKQLEEALIAQREQGGKLGDVLINKGFLKPEEIQKALSVQLSIPFVQDIPIDDIDATLVDNIPINFAKENEVIPLEKKDGIIKVAITNPLEQNALDDLRIILKGRVTPVIASPLKIQDAINRVYEKKEEKAMANIG